MSATSLQDERRRARTPAVARDFLRSTHGWSIVSPAFGDRGGMVAHRGVLHPDEYADTERLMPVVERRLGFTVDELRTAYRQGRKSAAQRELRARIDARFLELRRSGGNLELLARISGVDRKTIGRAMARAGRCLWRERYTFPRQSERVRCLSGAASTLRL